MNNINMPDELKIVNDRIIRMLDSNQVNNELFYSDVRTLTELIELNLDSAKKEGRA